MADLKKRTSQGPGGQIFWLQLLSRNLNESGNNHQVAKSFLCNIEPKFHRNLEPFSRVVQSSFCVNLYASIILCKYSLFSFGKWYFVTKIVLTYCERKLFYWLRKTFEIRGWRMKICKFFEITRTIHSNTERSEEFLVTKCFFNLFLEVSQI